MTNHYDMLRGHPLRILATLAAALVIGAASLAATAPSASADSIGNACSFNVRTHNACLRFDDLGQGEWDAVAAIDVHLPEQYGREIIACGADFKASLFGDDGGFGQDDFITNLVLKPGFPSVATDGPPGIGAEFSVPAFSFQLDEDQGEDELYAVISYFDCHSHATSAFRTGTVHHFF
jgi:hypothetical protein